MYLKLSIETDPFALLAQIERDFMGITPAMRAERERAEQGRRK